MAFNIITPATAIPFNNYWEIHGAGNPPFEIDLNTTDQTINLIVEITRLNDISDRSKFGYLFQQVLHDDGFGLSYIKPLYFGDSVHVLNLLPNETIDTIKIIVKPLPWIYYSQFSWRIY